MLIDDLNRTLPSAEAWTVAFGAGTVLLAVAVSVPQFIRLRSGGAAGVSLPAVLNSAISFLAWTLFALWTHDTWMIASSALGLPFAAATAFTAWRVGARRTGLWVPALWVAILVTACLLQASGAWQLVSLAVGMSIGWLVVPAAVMAWTSADVSGVAAGSWWVLAIEGALFLGYGLAGQAPAPVLYGVVALLGSAAVLARLALGSRPPAQGSDESTVSSLREASATI